MWMPRPSSLATDSAKRDLGLAPGARLPAGGRRARRSCGRTRRSGSRAPSGCRARAAPRASSPSSSSATSAQATVFPVSTARFDAGSMPASSARTSSTPSAAHSAAIRSSSASPPSRTRQRAAPRAVPASSTATRMTESKSSSERTLRAIDDSSRSRSSASSSADAERARSSASAASAATVRSGPSSSGENARCSWVVATASTAITRSPATSGTKAALRAPTLCGDSLVDERRGVRVVDRHGRDLERRARHARRLVPEVEADVAPRVEVHAVPAGEQAAALAELVVDEDEPDELHREQRGDLVQHDPRDRLGVSRAGERVGDRLDRLELALAERRPLLGSAATPEEPVEPGGATIRLHWAIVMIGPRAAARRGRFLTCKDGSYGLLAGRRPQITVVRTGRCEPRPTWLQRRGEH